MRCPFCGADDTQVKDSRPTDDRGAIRRRRFCPNCAARFTTFERVQLRELTVIKKNGQREPFERDKLLAGIERQELAEAVHAGIPLPEGVRSDGGGDAGEVVAHGQHLAAGRTHREQSPRLMPGPADGALDVGDEHAVRERDGPSVS